MEYMKAQKAEYDFLVYVHTVPKRNTLSYDWSCSKNNMSKCDTARKRPNSVQSHGGQPLITGAA